MVYRQLNLRLWANAAVELGAWALGRRRRLRVQGDSMLPTLGPGEFVLADPKRQPTGGSIVVVDHPDYEMLLIKRIAREMTASPDSQMWLLSDNPDAGTDSRRFGSVDLGCVRGVVTLVLNRPFLSEASLR